MKSTIRLTIIATMIIVGLALMFGEPTPSTTEGEWLTSIGIGIVITAVGGWLFATWDAEGKIAEESDKEW